MPTRGVSNRRIAMTLVELLVVLAIVGGQRPAACALLRDASTRAWPSDVGAICSQNGVFSALACYGSIVGGSAGSRCELSPPVAGFCNRRYLSSCSELSLGQISRSESTRQAPFLATPLLRGAAKFICG
jgi:hypothetical protein